MKAKGLKKRMHSLIGSVLAGVLVFGAAGSALAANHTAAELAEPGSSVVLYPGDSICEMAYPIIVDDEGVEAGENASWTNLSAGDLSNRAFRATYIPGNEEGAEGFYDIRTAGYILTVTDGTSSSLDGVTSGNHNSPEDLSDPAAARTDTAWYPAGERVRLDPMPAPVEGQVFQSFEAESGNVDVMQEGETWYIVMPTQEVRLHAVFVDPITEAQQDEGQPEGDAQAEGQPEGGVPGEEGQAEGGVPENWQAEGGQPEYGQEGWSAQEGQPDITIDGQPVVTIDGQPGMTVDGQFVESQDGQPAAPAEQSVQVTVEDQGPVQMLTPEGEPTEEFKATDPFANIEQIEQNGPDPNAPVGSIFDQVDESSLEITNQEVFTDQATQGQGVEGQAAQPAEVAPAENAEAQGDVEEAPQEPVTEPQTEDISEAITEPVTEQPALQPEQPVTEQPAPQPEQPATEQPVQEEATPIAEPATELVTEEPATEQPVQPEPATEQPAQEEAAPAAEPATEQSVQPEPATEPTTEQPASPEQPVTEQPEQTQEEAVPAAESADLTSPQTEAQPEQTIEEPKTLADPETTTGTPVATYKVTFTNPADVTVTGTDGTAYVAAEGATVPANTVLNLTANTADSTRKFTGWTVSSQNQTAVLSKPNEPATQLTVGAEDASVTANYIPIRQVVVSSGSGAGMYAQGERVVIQADKPETGWRFDHWTVLSGNAPIEDIFSSKTGFVMPGEDVKVRAEYELIEYVLSVSGGKGSGEYTMDTEVSLEADWPAEWKEFDKWVITSGHPDISGADRFYAVLTMPASDVSVKSVYKDGPNPAYNAIEGLVGGMEYLKGATLTFHAAGVGMDNTSPNPGDYRYKPTGYHIGSVSGGWQDSNFTTSMAINAVGDYTLTVTFTREIYRDGAWTSDGTVDTKSVSFRVVNALSVQTGDTTPLMLMILAAAGALLVILLTGVLLRRRS